MTKYLITGDIHLNDNIRDSYRHDFMAKTLPALIKKHDVDRLILLGDLTDDKDRHAAWLVNKIVGHLHSLSHLCDITIVRGNHDYLDEANPFFEFTKHLQSPQENYRIRWINKPISGKEEVYWRGHGGSLTFLPHTTNPQKDWKGMNFGKYVFCHHTFAGAHAEHGRELSGIDQSVFPKGTIVISGDVHVPQKLGCVTYVGAPYTINFGDGYEPRVLLLDNKLTSIPVPGPQKLLIELNGITSFEAAKGDIVKLRVHIAMDEMAYWSSMKDQLREHGARLGCSIHSIHPVVEYESAANTVHEPYRRQADDELLRSYAKARGVDDKLLQVGLKLMEKGA